MDRRDGFDDLVARAREERAPPVDVTHRVLAAIAARRGGRAAHAASRVAQRPLVLCAAGALVAASVVALLAANDWTTLDDPVAALLAGMAAMNP
jgi:hypothetical protein